MNEPDDPAPEPRVHCPRCGKRFRVDPASLEGKPDGAPARCSGCRAPFTVRRTESGGLEVLDPATAASRADATPRRGGSRRRRKRRPPGPSRRTEKATTQARAGARARADASVDLGIGERIGRYEIEALLGRGGMGAVYRAFDPAANRHVALKVLAAGAPEEDRRRFRREVEVQGNIQHPHIMPILDSGTLGRSRYFTMELLRDPIDLAELVTLGQQGLAAKDPHLRPASTLRGLVRRIVLPVCQALYHANVREGVLHRDLKPRNVLLDRNGLHPFVIDFGVCSLLERKNRRLAHLPTETPERLLGGKMRVTGTLLYMPPEQARGGTDRRGDVWALGAILHYVVSGAPPVEPATRAIVSTGDQAAGLRMLIDRAHRKGDRRDEREFRLKLDALRTKGNRSLEDLQRDVLSANYLPRPARTPRALDAIIAKAMDAEPEQRYRHALDLHDDLQAWLEGRPVRAVVQQRGLLLGGVYRAGLLLKRHRRATALLLVAGVLGAWAATSLLAGGGGNEVTPDRGEVLLGRAQRAAEDGKDGDARRLALEALRTDETADEAQRLLAFLERRQEVARRLVEADEVARQACEAFEAGRWAEGRARADGLGWIVSDGPPGSEDGLTEEERDRYPRIGLVLRGERDLVLGCVDPALGVRVVPVDPDGRALWPKVAAYEPAKDPLVLRFGSWLLGLSRGRGEAWVRVAVTPGQGPLPVSCPDLLDRVPEGCVYVGAGTVRGPLGASAVGSLFWDRTEVTAVRYADFLATLEPDERRRRAPRVPGAPGAPDRLLWTAGGDAFTPPADARRRPVEGISLHDARAYAKHAGGRLPTAAEWAWAASGGDGRILGVPPEVLVGGVRIARPGAGPADVATTPADRNPFGLFDMAGNLAEYTGTLATYRGTSGWLLMGGGYDTSPGRALVVEAEPVPGWLPRLGVGFRLVYEP